MNSPMDKIRLVRKIRLGLIFFIALLQAAISLAAEEMRDGGIWVASWGASPLTFQSFGNAPPPAPFENQTLRQVIRLSVGGRQLRVRLSNESGDRPVTIGSATVAVVATGSSVMADSVKTITFGGEAGITIPPGAPALSDPVDMPTDALTQLAVSLYLPDETPQSTVHMGRIAYSSSEGDFTRSATVPGAEQSAIMAFLSGVYVLRDQPANVVVALGDSITDGTASTPFTFNSWPDQLTERLAAAGIDNVAVINQGIAGNQVLRDGAGISALARFDRDVLSTPGLTHIVLLEGINDIGTGGFAFPGTEGPAPAMRSADDIIAGYRQLINRAHAMSPPIKIYGATLTPFEGTFQGYYTPEKEPIRKQVNEWIRTSGMFDGVIDFELAVRDPDNPNRMKAEYNSGDNLHPGDAGYDRMAQAIDLNMFMD